jgi:hypothetical protein
MDWICSKHARDEKFIQNCGRKTLKGRDYSENLGVDDRG